MSIEQSGCDNINAAREFWIIAHQSESEMFVK